jgi:hypothetical protein
MKLSSPSLGFGYRAVACLPAGRQVLLAALRGTAAIPRPSAFEWLFSFGAYVCGSQIRCIYSSGCPTEHPEQGVLSSMVIYEGIKFRLSNRAFK